MKQLTKNLIDIFITIIICTFRFVAGDGDHEVQIHNQDTDLVAEAGKNIVDKKKETVADDDDTSVSQ